MATLSPTGSDRRPALALTRLRAAAGIGDALVASGAMFLVQLALIGLAPKEEYGAYSLLLSYILAGLAALSAMFGAPLITSASALGAARRTAALALATRWHLGLVLVLAGTGGLVAALIPTGFPAGDVVATIAAFVGLALRDIQRVNWTIELQPARALASSLTFALVTVAVLVVMHFTIGGMSSRSALAAIALAAIATIAAPLVRRCILSGEGGRDAVAAAGAHARWTLPGVAVIWLQNNFYLTVLTMMAGLTAVAEISAARMPAVPVLLAIGALTRLNQVELGGLVAAGRTREAFSAARRMARHYLGCGLVLAAGAAAAARSPLDDMLPDYPGLFGLAALWFVFAGVSSARGALSTLMQAAGLYRLLFLANLIAVPVALIGLVVLIPLIGAAGAIVSLIAAELEFALLLLWLMGRQVRRPPSGA